MASPTPPGNEASILRDQQIENELLGFLKNECLADFSAYKGHSYVYKMNNFSSVKAHTFE